MNTKPTCKTPDIIYTFEYDDTRSPLLRFRKRVFVVSLSDHKLQAFSSITVND